MDHDQHNEATHRTTAVVVGIITGMILPVYLYFCIGVIMMAPVSIFLWNDEFLESMPVDSVFGIGEGELMNTTRNKMIGLITGVLIWPVLITEILLSVGEED